MFPLRDVNPTRHRAWVTLALIVACVGVWLLWQQEPQRSATDDLVFNLEHAAIPCELTQGEPLSVAEVTATYGTYGGDAEACGNETAADPPAVPGKNVWLAVVASMFFHGGLLHIGGNLLYLWIFGNNVEDHLGHGRYVALYLLGGVAATAAHVVLQPDSTVPIVGASGAVAAVMGAYLVWFPRAPVKTVLFLGFPFLATIQARWLLGVWFVLQFVTSPNSGVAWAAHVGGFVFGVAVAALIRWVPGAARWGFRADYAAEVGDRWDPTGGAGDVRRFERVGRRSG